MFCALCSMLRSEADGCEPASCHRDGPGTDAGRLPGRQCPGLYHGRDAHPGLDAGQR